jgi:hypothetical protein
MASERYRLTTRALCLWLAVAFLPWPARTALGAPGQTGREPTTARTAELTHQLASKDPQAIRAAIDGLAELGATAALIAFFDEGQPDAVADYVLAALARARSEDSFALLARSTRHRRVSARLQAYASLATRSDARVAEILGSGLRDSSAQVRGLCARLLGELRALDQLELLFRALARGVPEAGAAIGLMAPGSDVPRFGEHLQKLPVQVMLDGYERFLLRDDVSEPIKLDIVARLGEVASPTVKQFLQRMLGARKWPKKSALRHALIETSRRIVSDAKPAGSAK